MVWKIEKFPTISTSTIIHVWKNIIQFDCEITILES